MRLKFTIAPRGDFQRIAERLHHRLENAIGVKHVRAGDDTVFYFGGREEMEGVSMGSRGLASLRVAPGSAVIGVDLEGYEASAMAVVELLRDLLVLCEPYRIFDDETGFDLTWKMEHDPAAFTRTEPEFRDEGGSETGRA